MGVPDPTRQAHVTSGAAPPADHGRVLVAWCRSAALPPDALAAAGSALSVDERVRRDRFGRPDDRRDYTAAHAVLRAAIGHRIGVSPAELAFDVDVYGKPFVVPVAGAPHPPQFSLSRGRGLVGVALADGGMVGIDIEPVDASRDVMGLAAQVLAPSELRMLDASPTSMRAQRFFHLWTLREALFKAVGFGLAAPPSCAAFDLHGGTATVETRAPLPHAAWTCVVCRPSPTHAMAVVASSGRHGAPGVKTVEVTADAFRSGDRAWADGELR